MIKWDPTTRSLTFSLPRWTELVAGRYRRQSMVVAFILLADILVSYVDRPLAETMRQMDPGLRSFFAAITDIGDSKYTLIPIALVLPFLFATLRAIEASSLHRIVGWLAGALTFIFVAVAGSGLLVNVIKMIVGRTRPVLDERYGEYGFAPFTLSDSAYHSFPSGHSNTVFALAIAVSFFLPRLRTPLLICAALVAFSRVATTRHYLSDIIAGGGLGIWTTYWLRGWFARRGWVFVQRQDGFRVAAPGQLLSTKMREWLWRKLGGPQGPQP